MMLRTAATNALRTVSRRSANTVFARTFSEEASLWDRMGGEAVIKPMVGEIYDLHASDPLSAQYFGGGKFKNTGDADHVKDKVFKFFSAGIGGPHEYDGKSMEETHAGMKISQQGFHAICFHVISKMEEHKAGGFAEREEVLTILNSLKDAVLERSEEENPGDGFVPFDAKK